MVLCEFEIAWDGGSKTIEVEPNESDVWREVGKCLLGILIPNTITISYSGVIKAKLKVGKRGTFRKDGVTYPSMYVTPLFNNLVLKPSKYEMADLTCINAESGRAGAARGNYKYYKLLPIDSGDVTVSLNAEWGRIGAQPGEMYAPKQLATPYEPYLYWIRYYEKLSKGYKDRTRELHRLRVKKSDAPAKMDTQTVQPPTRRNPVSEELYAKLISYSRHVVKKALVSGDNITASQVEACRRIMKKLRARKTVKGFNAQLGDLMTICPRRVDYVSDQMAYSTRDFAKIIDREEDLLNAMEAVVAAGNKSSTPAYVGSFDEYDIEVYEATPEQKAQVLDKMSDMIKPKVSKIWRVIPKKQKAAFDAYLKKNGIKTVRQFWHGSKNENFFSIMTNSLMLHPNAQITGKMLGDGIYFAPSSMKSFNYTSFQGTTWAHGNSRVAYMGLFATAYGHPLDASNDIRRYTKAELQQKHKDCVHAKAGSGGWLRNDEVVFYDENAVLMQYLVEFKAS